MALAEGGWIEQHIETVGEAVARIESEAWNAALQEVDEAVGGMRAFEHDGDFVRDARDEVSELHGIVARDAGCGTLLAPSSEWPEYQTMADRRALLALVREKDAALLAAYEAMDAALRWAANETAGVKTLADADRHMKGYDALLDATVLVGKAAGILRDPFATAALDPKEPS